MLSRSVLRFKPKRLNALFYSRALSTSNAFNNQNQHNSKSFKAVSSGGAILLGSALAATFLLSSEKHNDKPTLLELSSSIIDEDGQGGEDETTTVINWSGTHSIEVANKNYFEPETIAELEEIVANCHKKGQPIRPVGSALSPNAISFNSGGMISMMNLDRIIKVDKDNMTVTVEAGARVSQVVDALREHGLTLPNLASIAEQQMGGFVQIGAHGTGAKISPVDEFVTSLKLVTPARGTVGLTAEDGEMFQLAKVGLGCLDVVSE